MSANGAAGAQVVVDVEFLGEVVVPTGTDFGNTEIGGGTGNVVVINEVSTQGATDVLDNEALYEGGTPVPFVPVFQTEVFAFDDLGIPIDNIEGMTFGPSLPDGRNTLIIVSDNNFSPGQFTQFILLALDIEPLE
jgi:hypothetical protein